MTDRRKFMQAVAGLAATRWDDAAYDIETAAQWDPIRMDTYTTGEVAAQMLRSEAEGPIGHWSLGADSIEDEHVTAWYDADGVAVDLQGRGDETRTSAMAMLTPDDAKHLAAALYQAAEEYQRRLSTE